MKKLLDWSNYHDQGMGDAYADIPKHGGNFAKAISVCIRSGICQKADNLVVELLFIVIIIYTPSRHRIFSTAPLDLSMWGMFLIAPVTLFAIEEFRKRLVRRGVDWIAV